MNYDTDNVPGYTWPKRFNTTASVRKDGALVISKSKIPVEWNLTEENKRSVYVKIVNYCLEIGLTKTADSEKFEVTRNTPGTAKHGVVFNLGTWLTGRDMLEQYHWYPQEIEVKKVSTLSLDLSNIISLSKRGEGNVKGIVSSPAVMKKE